MPTTSTFQSVEVASKPGKAFLRKVVRDNAKAGSFDGWTGHAGQATARDNVWYLEFRRTVSSGIGEADQQVAVLTDVVVGQQRKSGMIRPFHDADEVTIPSAQSVYIRDSQAALLATLLADGWRGLSLDADGGSTSSSKHGIATIALTITHPKHPYARVELGASMFVHGQTVISGPANTGGF